MRALLLIAGRNLLRNRRRTLLSALAVVVGLGAAVALRGFADGFVAYAVDDAVHARAGAIQVHKAGYREADHNLLDYAFADEPALRDRITAVPGVTAAAPRLSFEGMAANGTVSSMAIVQAIDPAREYLVCPRRRDNVQAGGRALDATMGADAIIGSTLGAFLGAKPGDMVTLQSATRNGAANAHGVTVRGYLPAKLIFESKRMVSVPLSFAQELLLVPGEITEYAVAIERLDDVNAVAARVRAAVGPGYAVETWDDIVPDVRDRMARLAIVMNTVVIVLALLVATGIINTMMMSVFERVREIGTMLAVGVRRRQVLLLFLLEAGALGAVGAVIGMMLGAALVGYYAQHGVTIQPPGGDPITVVPLVHADFLARAVVLAICGCMVAALLPAWRASRLRPVDALRST